MACCHILRDMGINVVKQCLNGFEAVKFVEDEGSQNIDFILLDLDMPILDGFEACQQLIKYYDEKMEPRPMIVAYSGFVDEHIKLQALNTGFDDIL